MLSSNTFVKGLNQDVHPKHQLEGTYRFGLNGVVESTEGELPAVSNELGTVYCADNWPEDKTLIGHRLTDNDDIVVFFYDSTPIRPEHEIGIYNPTSCSYRTIVIDQLLNFSDQHPINALFRIRNGCDRFIYFTDNYNPYRVINITDTTDWVDPTFLSLVDHTKILYSRHFNFPTIDIPSGGAVQNSGGQVEYGVYSPYFRYLDIDYNPTNEWIPLTNYIPVGRGSQSNDGTTLLSGAANEPSSPLFYPKSTKAIKLDLVDLDSKFSYYQIAMVKRTALDGSISGVDVLFPQSITGSTDSFVYTGLDSEILTETDIAEILVPTQRIYKVGAHEINERKLFLSNLTNVRRDYSTYQRYASQVKVTYQATGNDSRISKSPNSYIFPVTLDPDEVISLGLVFIHDDGSLSPALHIPGRPKDFLIPGENHLNPYIDSGAWDTEDITGDPNIFNPSKTQRWQVYSTASIDNSSTLDEFFGYLGYHESLTATYPEIQTCNTDDDIDYWGEDWQGNTLLGQPIRHHRVPAQWLYPSEFLTNYSEHKQYNYNLVVENVEFPDSTVVGYYIVIGDRTTERTVLDRGFIKPFSWDTTDESYYFTSTDWANLNVGDTIEGMVHYGMVTPSTVYNETGYTGDYISIEKRLITTSTDSADTTPVGSIAVSVGEFGVNVDTNSRIYQFGNYTRPTRLNYPILTSDYLSKVPITAIGSDQSISVSASAFIQSPNGDRVENRSRAHNIAYYQLDGYMEELDELPFIGAGSYSEFEFEGFTAIVKADRDVFNNLFTINYKQLSPNIMVTQLDPENVGGGDMFTPVFDTLDWYWNDLAVESWFINAIMVSSINTEFRYFSDIDRGRFTHYRHGDEYNHELVARYIASKYYEAVADQETFFPEYYEINPSYNTLLTDRYHLPIPYDYEFCNDCIESFPYRTYYSETDNEEQRQDNFRIIKANNYSNIEGEDGPITDLFISFNQMYVASANALKRLPIRAQTLQSNENSIYIGTAEVLSIPPIDMKTTDWALGGVPNFKYRTNTEFGMVYVDPLSARVYLLSNQLNDISANGLRNFWQENGKLFLNEQFKSKFGTEYPCLYTTASFGIGYTLTYDPRYKRLIIHKKDYKILPKHLSRFEAVESSTIPNAFWFSLTDNNYYKNNASGTPTKVAFGDPFYFESKCFTLSYSFITNAWAFFHSYFPKYLMNNYSTFFSDGPWKHNSGNYQTYYGTKYPFVLDIIAQHNPLDAKLSTNIFYTSNVTSYDETSNAFKQEDITFDKLICYNSSQTTGYQDIFPKTEFLMDIDETSVLVDKVDGKYRISNIRDYTLDNNEAIWSYAWDNLQAEPYLDRAPNINNIDQTKSLYELRRFRDHYLGLRLFFTPEPNYKITTDIISTQYANRNR